MSIYNSYDDCKLTNLLKQGDLRAFKEIHERYYGILYRHAYSRLPDREEVKDILQELFICIWNNRESINLNVSLKAYLYTSIRNRILNVFKHDKVKSNYVASFVGFMHDGEPIADEAIRIKELMAIIEAEVAALPPKMRLVFEMSRNEHFSYQEIADKLDISVLTVRKQIQNSLKILRVKLGAYLSMLLL